MDRIAAKSAAKALSSYDKALLDLREELKSLQFQSEKRNETFDGSIKKHERSIDSLRNIMKERSQSVPRNISSYQDRNKESSTRRSLSSPVSRSYSPDRSRAGSFKGRGNGKVPWVPNSNHSFTRFNRASSNSRRVSREQELNVFPDSEELSESLNNQRDRTQIASNTRPASAGSTSGSSRQPIQQRERPQSHASYNRNNALIPPTATAYPAKVLQRIPQNRMQSMKSIPFSNEDPKKFVDFSTQLWSDK